MALTARVAKTASASIPHAFLVDETPTDSTTAVTVAITDATGAAVTSGTAASAGAGTGRYTFALPPQAQLQELTVAWSGTIAGAAVTELDTVQIVGTHYFTLAQARASDSSLTDTVKYTTTALKDTRLEVEVECERICGRAFVPRYRRVVLDGTGIDEVTLPDPDVRTIRSVQMAARAGLTFTPLSAAALAALVVTDAQTLKRVDYNFWTEGLRNLIVEYEFGLDSPPSDLREAALVRLRSRINKHKTGVPDRAISFTPVEGGTYRISLPNKFSTGIPDVDAIYSSYAAGGGAGTANGTGASPASRTLQYDPQYLSLYHGGRK